MSGLRRGRHVAQFLCAAGDFVQHNVVQLRRGADHAGRTGRVLIKFQSISKSIAHCRARFAGYQAGRGNIPFIAPAKGSGYIGLVAGHHRHTQGDAIGFVDFV